MHLTPGRVMEVFMPMMEGASVRGGGGYLNKDYAWEVKAKLNGILVKGTRTCEA
jgi:hypothetical protein